MAEPSRIVAIGAHAADMEFSAGATLLKHVRRGWEAHLIHLTLGEKGSAMGSAEEYGAQKRQEAEATARCLGATPHFLPYRDGELQVDEETARALATLLRTFRPRVAITHWRQSIHGDHVATHHLTRRAIFLAANRHFDLEGLDPVWTPVYCADNWEDAEGFTPHLCLDVSDEVPAWREAFSCFAIGRGEGGFPYWDWYEARTRLHGIALGCRHAQAFAVEEPRRVQKRDLL